MERLSIDRLFQARNRIRNKDMEAQREVQLTYQAKTTSRLNVTTIFINAFLCFLSLRRTLGVDLRPGKQELCCLNNSKKSN